MKSRFFLRQMPQCSQAVLRIESYGYTTTNLRPREVTPGDLMMLKLYSGFGSFEILNSHLKKIRLAAVKKSLYGCKIRQGKCLLQDLCERLLAIYEMPASKSIAFPGTTKRRLTCSDVHKAWSR